MHRKIRNFSQFLRKLIVTHVCNMLYNGFPIFVAFHTTHIFIGLLTPPDCELWASKGILPKCITGTGPQCNCLAWLGWLDGYIACVQHRERCSFAYAQRLDFSQTSLRDCCVIHITFTAIWSFIWSALHSHNSGCRLRRLDTTSVAIHFTPVKTELPCRVSPV